MKAKMRLFIPWSIDTSQPDSEVSMETFEEGAGTMLFKVIDRENNDPTITAITLNKYEVLKMAEMLKFFADTYLEDLP